MKNFKRDRSFCCLLCLLTIPPSSLTLNARWVNPGVLETVRQWRLCISTISQQRFEIKDTLHKIFIFKLDIKRWKSAPQFHPLCTVSELRWVLPALGTVRAGPDVLAPAARLLVPAGHRQGWRGGRGADLLPSRAQSVRGLLRQVSVTVSQCLSVSVSQSHRVTGS